MARKTKTGYSWALARDDRPWGGASLPGVLFTYAPGQGGQQAERIDFTCLAFQARSLALSYERAQGRRAYRCSSSTDSDRDAGHPMQLRPQCQPAGFENLPVVIVIGSAEDNRMKLPQQCELHRVSVLEFVDDDTVNLIQHCLPHGGISAEQWAVLQSRSVAESIVSIKIGSRQGPVIYLTAISTASLGRAAVDQLIAQDI